MTTISPVSKTDIYIMNVKSLDEKAKAHIAWAFSIF